MPHEGKFGRYEHTWKDNSTAREAMYLERNTEERGKTIIIT
jgi:hypothetical protein